MRLIQECIRFICNLMYPKRSRCSIDTLLDCAKYGLFYSRARMFNSTGRGLLHTVKQVARSRSALPLRGLDLRALPHAGYQEGYPLLLDVNLDSQQSQVSLPFWGLVA
jgi:hypothetical protein